MRAAGTGLLTPAEIFTIAMATARCGDQQCGAGMAPLCFCLFVGATIDGVVEDAVGNEGDALLMSSGFHKRSPYLARQRCRRKPQPPMGPGGPLLVRQEGVTLHKEQTSVGQHDRDHVGIFTQVRATVSRKTLLLVWWIDGGKEVVEHSTLARQGLPQGGSGYSCMGV